MPTILKPRVLHLIIELTEEIEPDTGVVVDFTVQNVGVQEHKYVSSVEHPEPQLVYEPIKWIPRDTWIAPEFSDEYLVPVYQSHPNAENSSITIHISH